MSRFIFFIVCFYVFGLATVSSTSAQEDPQKNKSDNAEASKNVDISFEQELTNFYAILKEKEKEKRELTQR